MASTEAEAYLDQVCAGLRADAAAVEDIREELRSHWEELVASCRRDGACESEAAQVAASELGDARRLRAYLALVHQGDALWLRCLKAWGFGMLIGSLLSGVLALADPAAEYSIGLSVAWFGAGAEHSWVVLNGALVGGMIGCLAATSRGLLLGPLAGSVVWLGEHVVQWVTSTLGGGVPAGAALGAFNLVLLSPVLGAVFGAMVSAGAAAALSAASRPRPEIR